MGESGPSWSLRSSSRGGDIEHSGLRPVLEHLSSVLYADPALEHRLQLEGREDRCWKVPSCRLEPGPLALPLLPLKEPCPFPPHPPCLSPLPSTPSLVLRVKDGTGREDFTSMVMSQEAAPCV